VRPPLLDKLRSIVGAQYTLTGVELSPFVIEGRSPDVAVFPGSVEEVSSVLALASGEEIPVNPWGGGTKMGLGSPPQKLGVVLGLKRLHRLLEHEPGDLTATLQAGMTLEALEATLSRSGQWLSLDPAFPERATLGGILATNASGPRRHLYGTARDLLIGITVVEADGAVVHGGGKVVKNVAGYDLPKLYIGSFGSLGVIVELTVKLRPLPEDDRALLVRFQRLKECAQALRLLMGSDLIPSAVELLDGEALGGLDLSSAEGGALLIGFDGLPEQVEWQAEEARKLFEPLGLAEWRLLDGPARDRAWRAVREVGHRVFPEPAAVVKLGVLPTQVVETIEQTASVAQRNGLRSAFSAHPTVGIVTGVLAGGGQLATPVITTLIEWRDLVRSTGGHLALEWAPLAVKEQVAAWDPPGPEFKIMERLKAKLDPKGILNPGRFVGGL
jgi:glycolate oxidase FAD binding subunit